jgi:hypothetical protein
MWKKLSAAGALSALGLVWVLSAQSPAQKAIEDSLKAMGISDVKTLTISGEGGDGFVGQHLVPDAPKWRWYSNKDFVRGYDFDNKGYRTKRVRGEGNVPPGGGAGTTTPAPTQNLRRSGRDGDDPDRVPEDGAGQQHDAFDAHRKGQEVDRAHLPDRCRHV